MRFTDREEAGKLLAERLRHLRDDHPVVLGLPRGGVPVAFEVARELSAPMDVIVVRKLGVPYHPELGFGAIGEGGVRVIRDDIVQRSGVSRTDMAVVERAEEEKLQRQARQFRGDEPRIALHGRTVIIVDDGIATGGTAKAACQVARAQGAARVILAVPVAPADTVDTLRREADELVCLSAPEVFYAVGEWYRDFSQTTDDEVVSLLQATREAVKAQGAHAAQAAEEAEVRIDAGGVELIGDLKVPEGAPAIVVFAHGSGSSRRSPRNRSVAQALNGAGLGTLLFDLLTREEELDRANVFDIEVLAGRLMEVTRWLRRRESAPISYFGASTGAAAALRAAAGADMEIAAVVSRGGRPDLAGPALAAVRAPTLLIVGGNDEMVLDLNRRAQAELRCESQLAVVPEATHLFEEPGALEEVAELARDWFLDHTAPARRGTPSAA
ncbi:phosphoribosyltransferase [Streptomyces gobiensis]|uniref:phosphoribosyltransferase n=1 Tax=Streptomyces gobiensis TaxID=2875706 RepID=UPI001E4F3FC1|nr:phosphoribosyltransferase [Streptomyces gobiensis]UGY91023.1 phosphoribosyltransferase [Streptomyces gobiensis]